VNRSLSPRDRGHRSGDPGGESRPAWSLPGAVRLVGGVAAVASKPRVGHRCAIVGPRALGARTGQPVLGNAPEVEEPARGVPGGPGRREALDATC
jgi:hypothetical protein